MTPSQEANVDNLGNFFNLLDNNVMLSVLLELPQCQDTTS